MEFGENAAYWAEQKVEYLVTTTKMDEPLKKLDTAALNGTLKIENTLSNVSIHKFYCTTHSFERVFYGKSHCFYQ